MNDGRADDVQDVRERALDYGIRAGRIVSQPFLRSATSIRANCAEAPSGETRELVAIITTTIVNAKREGQRTAREPQ